MKINRSVKKEPIPTKVSEYDLIVQACASNPNATNLTAEKTNLETKGGALDAIADEIQIKQDQLSALFVQQAAAEAEADAAFDAFCDKAQTETGGDADKIRSLHLVPYEPGAAPAIGAMTQVLNLAASTGDFEGTIELQWDKVRGARQYMIQMTTTPADAASWKLISASVRSSFLAEGLTSGTKYYFRVAAVGTSGQGPWSDLVAKMAA